MKADWDSVKADWDCVKADAKCNKANGGEGRGPRGSYLSSVPGDLLFIFRSMVVKVCDSVQPHHIEPVGHEVQVEHGQGP